MGEKLGIRAYARSKNVSHVAVLKAIKTGRLARAVSRDRAGRPRIDAAIADLEWDDNVDPSARRERKAGGRPTESERGLFGDVARAAAPRPSDPNLPSYTDSRAIRELYQARLARLEYEKQAGNLVDADGVRVEAYKAGRSLRDSLLSFPSRVAARLAAETSEHAVREILLEEMRLVLEQLSDEGLGRDKSDGDSR